MADFPGWLSGEKARLENAIRLRKLEKVASDLRLMLDGEDITDTGRLRDSVTVNVTKDTVIMRAPYAPYVEKGRRPGKMPPYDKMRKWVGHKLGITGRKEARKVTFAIMRKIGKSGVKPTNVLSRAWRRVTR